MATPESIAAPIENQGLMDRYLDYIQGDLIAQQVSGGDPLKKALRGISEFIPGISTALAERRGDKFGEALSYLDYLGPAGGGAKLAGMGFLEMMNPLIAKFDKQLKKLKFDYDREMRNAQSGDGSAAYEAADKIKKKMDVIERKRSAEIVKEQAKTKPIPKETMRQMQIDFAKEVKGPSEILPVLKDQRTLDDIGLDYDKAILRGEYTTKNPNPSFPGSVQLTGKTFPEQFSYADYSDVLSNPTKLKELKLKTGPDLRYSTERDPTLIGDYFGASPNFNLDRLFHGSQTKGIGSLQLPTKTGSTGGLYSLVDPLDPRFKSFARGMNSRGEAGSGYVLKPNFNKPLDVENMPDDMAALLNDIQMYRSRPSRGDVTKLDFDLETIQGGMKGIPNKMPQGINKELADIFTGQGYDALRFGPRGKEASTVVSLDPSNLEILEEIPYDQLDDFIRAYLNPK